LKKIRNIAHVRQNKDETWTEHLLVEHLKNTARKACEFAKFFNAGDWAEIIALWHDLGKFVPDWQKYIRQGSGYDLDAHIETLGGKVNHSSAGAVLAFQKLKNCLPIARIIGYPIVGHHAGLPDWYPAEAPGFPLPERISKNSDMNNLDMKDLSRIMKIEEAIPFLKHPFPKTAPFGKANWRNWANHLHLWIRMIYSSLVDADFLDTEEFMSPENKEARGGYLSLLEDVKKAVPLVCAYHRGYTKLRTDLSLKHLEEKKKAVYEVASFLNEAKLEKSLLSLEKNIPDSVSLKRKEQILKVAALLRVVDGSDVQADRIVSNTYLKARLERTKTEAEALWTQLEPLMGNVPEIEGHITAIRKAGENFTPDDAIRGTLDGESRKTIKNSTKTLYPLIFQKLKELKGNHTFEKLLAR
jgi:CRISPR-associated endonuclease Cas3-HD